VPFSAGLMSYASWFSIPPRKEHFLVQNSCCYRGFQPLTTFAVRVHTHTMGRAVFMTKMPTDPKGEARSSSSSSGGALVTTVSGQLCRVVQSAAAAWHIGCL
jgi:hypothetical protein